MAEIATAKVRPPKFSKDEMQKLYFETLDDRVYDYLGTQSIYGNLTSFAKAIISILLYISFIYLINFVELNTWEKHSCAIMLGLLAPFIGFCVMHDAIHKSFSKYQIVNTILGCSLDMLGGSSFFWYWKHNVVHHTFTNINTYDEDITILWIRAHFDQPWEKKHRYQHLYWWLLYLLTYIAWIYYGDWDKLRRMRIGESSSANVKPMRTDQVIGFYAGKLWHVLVALIIPSFVQGPTWILYYLEYCAITGFSIAIVFQLAHVVKKVKFTVVPEPGENFEYTNKVHQLEHTADFAPDSKPMNFLLGGLNFQVEHHLFPEINSRHYPAIQVIVQNHTEEWNAVFPENQLEYHCFDTPYEGISSHVGLLKELGKEPQKLLS